MFLFFASRACALIFVGLSTLSPNSLSAEPAPELKVSVSAGIDTRELYPAEPHEDESPVRKVELVAVEAGNQKILRVGFYVELEPGWHLYWANPGDAGLAPAVRWTLPEGFTAGPLRHPVPEKKSEEGVVSFEHGGEALLLCEITPAPGHRAGEPWAAEAVFEWMACKESCVTGETAVRAVLPADPGSLAGGKALLARFADRFPRPLAEAGVTAGPGRAEWTGTAWRVEIPLAGPRAADADDFFVLPVEGFVIENAGVSCGQGKIIIPVIPSGGSGSPPPPAVEGIVVIDGKGYELATPVVSRRGAKDRIVAKPAGINLVGAFASAPGPDPRPLSSNINRQTKALFEEGETRTPVSFARDVNPRVYPYSSDPAACQAASWTHSILFGSWR